MRTIRVVMDDALMRATDCAAKRMRVNRSALIRQALREHLKRLRTQHVEGWDRSGYERSRDNESDSADWESVAVWPES